MSGFFVCVTAVSPAICYNSHMPYIRIHQQRLFYAKQGTLSLHPAVLLVHGAGGSHLDWPPSLRQLPNTAVYALDLPGHGRSEPPGRKTITDYTDAVIAFITQLELPKVVVIGHSMGGAIAQEVGLRQPDWLAGLVLVGTSARLKVSPALLDSTLANPAQAVDFITQYAWSPQADPARKALAAKQLSTVPPAILHDDYLACDGFNRIGQLSGITAPTLIISGSADKMTPAKFGKAMADEIPRAQYVEIEGAGHYLMLEQETAVSQAIQTFLDTLN